MKLMPTAVAFCAAMTRSASFSRSELSRTITVRPRRMSFSASSTFTSADMAASILHLIQGGKHGQCGAGGFKTFVHAIIPGTPRRVTPRVRGEHFKNHRHLVLDRHAHRPASALARHQIKVQRLALDDCAEGDQCIIALAPRELLREQGDFKAAWNCETFDLARLHAAFLQTLETFFFQAARDLRIILRADHGDARPAKPREAHRTGISASFEGPASHEASSLSTYFASMSTSMFTRSPRSFPPSVVRFKV